jgi:hypothetical protein
LLALCGLGIAIGLLIVFARWVFVRARSTQTNLTMKQQAFVTLIAMFQVGSLFGCQTFPPQKQPLKVTLVTDSAEITAYFRNDIYVADIGFTLTNNTAGTISRAGCNTPGWPTLEKKVNDRWVVGYFFISLMCRTIPDFSWDAGSQFHDVLKVRAAKPGTNTIPALAVEPIDGVYRLVWDFTEGREAEAKGARQIEVVSNEFHMTLSSSPAPASTAR